MKIETRGDAGLAWRLSFDVGTGQSEPKGNKRGQCKSGPYSHAQTSPYRSLFHTARPSTRAEVHEPRIPAGALLSLRVAAMKVRVYRLSGVKSRLTFEDSLVKVADEDQGK
jgi:hypothetical protein